jgi:hypothetical protein
MYPTTTFGLVKRAVDYFSSDFLLDEKETIKTCLKIIWFGMNNTLVTFQEKYYNYGGSDNDSKGLTIGGYESALLGDLAASFLLETKQECFADSIQMTEWHWTKFQYQRLKISHT